MTAFYREDTPTGATRLIVDPNDEQVLHAQRETDARSALTRGLAEYLHSLRSTINGQTARLKAVYPDWSEPENEAAFPSCAVTSVGGGEYEPSRLAPHVLPGIERYPGAYLVTPCELQQDLIAEVWCTGVLERRAIGAMLEDALWPVEWMYGFRLELPHYHGARATFEPKSVDYEDAEPDAKRRFRKLRVTVGAAVPVYRLITGMQTGEGRTRLSFTTQLGSD